MTEYLPGLGRFAPRDAPLWYASIYTAAGMVLCWMLTRWCNRRGL